MKIKKALLQIKYIYKQQRFFKTKIEIYDFKHVLKQLIEHQKLQQAFIIKMVNFLHEDRTKTKKYLLKQRENK